MEGYKALLHVNAHFVPSHRRHTLKINETELKTKSAANYKSIISLLRQTGAQSTKNYQAFAAAKIKEVDHYGKQIEVYIEDACDYIKLRRSQLLEYPHPDEASKNGSLLKLESEANKFHWNVSSIHAESGEKMDAFKMKTIMSFNSLCQKIKINISNCSEYNFVDDLAQAIKAKEAKLNLTFEDEYQSAFPKNEKKSQADMDFDEYDPDKVIFTMLNIVKLPTYQRKQLVAKYGNEHDQYQLNKFILSDNRKNERDKNKHQQRENSKNKNKKQKQKPPRQHAQKSQKKKYGKGKNDKKRQIWQKNKQNKRRNLDF